ncbi:inositol phosphorylceramide synthase [Mucilaginibacter limnophilus]|uniref:Inositol phosphorylceramide synthase n=1 Tax=Mucilaginibacter limnophilus TaxID=1932778 RepID=A0A437MTU4_9SPHI|nr:phosphatase PAP2 family protein [Mucilaginibacter limnophilus]RVU01067.1 inositol phosphorylceramide synthase [Mucilaginibacter limnophilus]
MLKTANAVTPKSVITVSVLSIVYLLLSWLLVGFKTDQVVLVLLFHLFYYATPISRKFIIGFSIFIVYWIVYDYMKAFPNYNYNTVHIADLYNFEKHTFGIHTNEAILTPNEYWRVHNNTFFNIITGIFYLCWIPVPMAFAVFLFFRNRKQFICFLLTFFFVNLLGFVAYYTFPAAPPWYVQFHGFEFIKGTPGNTAGLAKFDEFFNTGIFKSIYAKGSNVFAAMPSLHSSYPVIVLFYGLRNKLGLVNIFFATVMVGIWFSAVYTSHHYVLDVIFGVVCALVGILLFETIIARIPSVSRFINNYARYIE